MQPNVETAAPPKGKSQKGPSDDEVIKIDVVKENLKDLELLFDRQENAVAAYKDKIDAVATKAGINKQNLRALVMARKRDKVSETHQRVAQLNLLFEEFES
jgi:hypothetical protein